MLILSTDDFEIQELKVEHETSTLASSTVSWKETVMGRGLHRINVSGQIMMKDQDDVQAWQGFILGLQGRVQPFILDTGSNNDWHNPFFNPIRGVTCVHQVGIGVTKIGVTNTNLMKVGMNLQLGDQKKVYYITAIDRASNQITIFPPNRYLTPQGSPLSFDVKPVLRLDEDKYAMTYGARGKNISFKATEVML
ncbi:hypothetical protein V0242_11700 [Aeromonas hydrophila]|uniref:hypothetical protein n=1 Tax=Aeromonas hydrophila TaxID=644 RepID=UPI002ED2B4B5|nr:hypothetical protein V0242_11700 [Aeromonas hydrophila]